MPPFPTMEHTITLNSLFTEQLTGQPALPATFSRHQYPIAPAPQVHQLSPKMNQLNNLLKLEDDGMREVHCQVCGKMYKHKSCLSKHLWEHHEYWNATKKLCVSKHQQVQLLEAAQVLVNMTHSHSLSTSPPSHVFIHYNQLG